jgi:nitrogen fixation-related uncharacterized protein
MNLKKGQYEDTYTPSVRMLFDDEEKKSKKNLAEKEETTNKESITKQ